MDNIGQCGGVMWRIISPCYPGDGDMEELLGPASRDHPSVNLFMGDLGLDTALAGDSYKPRLLVMGHPGCNVV